VTLAEAVPAPDASSPDPTDSHIRARRTNFTLADLPLHWIPDDPQTTHTINVLHLFLPPGERWFCDVYREALPLVTDEKLRQDIKGFMGQEAVHARAHDLGVKHLEAHGIDVSRFMAQAEWAREHLGGPRPFGLRLGRRLGRHWLNRRLALIAAIEHFTSILGTWVVEDSSALDDAGADPEILDMLRWHGAEEVEHRSVAFDTFQAASGSYLLRVTTMLTIATALTLGWTVAAVRLLRADPTTHARFQPREFRRAVRQGRLPSLVAIHRSVPRYLRRDHHPSREPGSREIAIAYLANSPGVRRSNAGATVPQK
jgi:predicted metal-dependent hydrolase